MKKITIFISIFSLFLILLTPSLSAIEYSLTTEAIKKDYIADLEQEKFFFNLEFSLFFRLVLSIIYLFLLEGFFTVMVIFLILLMNFFMINIPFFTTVFGQILIGLLLGFIAGKISNLLIYIYDNWTDNNFKHFPKIGDILDTMMILLNIPAFWLAYRIVVPH